MAKKTATATTKKASKNNSTLAKAKAAKNDEFYTVIADIENEMNAYYDHNPNVFRGKTILCPCDDPTWSNFTRHFVMNFERYGLKKLICTGYNKDGHGVKYVLDGDTNGNGKIEEDDIVTTEMDGDGDFRSEEVKTLMDEADFVITNPPFSLFREFIAWIMENNKKFSIIGNVNAITYKEVFPLIKNDKIWLGESIHSGDRKFVVPDSYPLEAAGCGVDEDGNRFIRVKGVRWFTNIDHDVRHEPLVLSTKKQLEKDGVKFPKYDNYNAIEVSQGKHIPRGYKGVMGVPITWLDKYCPEQFEIVGITEANGVGMSGGTWNGGNKKATVNGEEKYARIFIKYKS